MGSDKTCCGRRYSSLKQSRTAQVIIFIVISGLNILDLCSDWLLFHDVDAAEKGLVFGPPEPEIRLALLTFCIIGSVLFTFEILNLGKAIFTEHPCMDVDVASAMIVWFEDIPQLTINCLIIACREEAISIFQLGKASVVILGAFIRMIIGAVRACRRKRSDNYQKLAQCNWFKFIMFFGFSLMIAGSITIFMFSQTTMKRDGSLKFHKINNLFEGEYDDEKYFERVGVYGDMSFLGEKTANGAEANSESKPWIKLFDIHDIRHLKSTIIVTLRHDGTNSFSIRTVQAQNISDEVCYHGNNLTWTAAQDINCSSLSSTPSSSIVTVTLKFQYVKPRNHLILGDILYNGVISANDSCATVPSSDHIMSLRYFQATSPYVAQGYLIPQSSNDTNVYSFHRIGKSLKEIKDVWKTGFLGCENSGSISPNFDASIPLTC